MIKIENGTASIVKTRALTPKQQLNLKQFGTESGRTRYLMSLLGITKERVSVNRIKSWGNDSLGLKGPNDILTQMVRLRNTNVNHVPSHNDKGEWVGVEIECLIPYDKVKDHYGRAVSENDSYTYLKMILKDCGVSRTTVKYDGSVGTVDDIRAFGVEVTVVYNAKSGTEPLERLCRALKLAGCFVNKTCGLHVHLDARNLKPLEAKRIAKRIGRSLPVVKWLVQESRHNNHYCKLGVSPLRGDRYYAVNLTAYEKYKTVEIRLHGGTTDFKKISNWVTLLKSISKCENILAPMVTFQDLLDVGLPDSMVTYLEERITDLYGNKAWSQLNPVPMEPVVLAPMVPAVPVPTAVISPVTGNPALSDIVSTAINELAQSTLRTLVTINDTTRSEAS